MQGVRGSLLRIQVYRTSEGRDHNPLVGYAGQLDPPVEGAILTDTVRIEYDDDISHNVPMRTWVLENFEWTDLPALAVRYNEIVVVNNNDERMPHNTWPEFPFSLEIVDDFRD